MTETPALRVDPSNIDQVRAWDGDEGAQWAKYAEQYESSLRDYQADFMAAAAISASDRVLDIGCGTGLTTRDAARRATSGSVLGVDLSSQMLRVARERAQAEGLRNVTFEQADAQVHPFATAAYDVAISRTGAMFFGDQRAAFANIARAVRPGGRLVLLAWQGLERNEWIRSISSALAAGRRLPAPPLDRPGPFSLGDPDRVRSLLGPAGFEEPAFETMQRPIYFGRGPSDAEALLLGQLGWMLEGLDDAARADAVAALRTTLAEHQGAEGIAYASAAWLVTARRSA